MAKRPIFVPLTNSIGVSTINTEFKWFSGMSKSQKQKSIEDLHRAGGERNIFPILEISTKSTLPEGVMMSAFNLKVRDGLTVESAYQASKVFDTGGPYIDILDKSSWEAKKDPRLVGKIICFEYDGQKFPANPINFFYDWLYIKALSQNESLVHAALQHNGFTDIEFNPAKSVNCQARAVALFASLTKWNRIAEALKSPKHFLKEKRRND